MGSVSSRLFQSNQNTRQPIISFDSFANNLRATGTYFGPNFVLESNGVNPETAASLAYWEDIVNVLSLSSIGEGNGYEIPGIGNIYSQLPPAELKTATTVQSNVNIQKSSLRINRNKDAAVLRYLLSFKFDTLQKSLVKLYWGAKEVPVADELGNISYRFVDKDTNPVEPWIFGPFPSKLNQEFKLPTNEEFAIDTLLLKKIGLDWGSKLGHPESQAIISNSNADSLEHIVKMQVDGSGNLGSGSQVPISVVVQKESTIQAMKENQEPYHLVIKLEAISPQGGNTIDSQYTFIRFSESNDRQMEPHVGKQLLTIKGLTYVLQEVYGFTESTTASDAAIAAADQMSQKECVVCMSENKEVIVLPCRHLCLCSSCANLLRMQGRDNDSIPTVQGPPRCPICRQIFHSLIAVSLPPSLLPRGGSKVSLFSSSQSQSVTR